MILVLNSENAHVYHPRWTVSEAGQRHTPSGWTVTNMSRRCLWGGRLAFWAKDSPSSSVFPQGNKLFKVLQKTCWGEGEQTPSPTRISKKEKSATSKFKRFLFLYGYQPEVDDGWLIIGEQPLPRLEIQTDSD